MNTICMDAYDRQDECMYASIRASVSRAIMAGSARVMSQTLQRNYERRTAARSRGVVDVT